MEEEYSAHPCQDKCLFSGEVKRNVWTLTNFRQLTVISIFQYFIKVFRYLSGKVDQLILTLYQGAQRSITNQVTMGLSWASVQNDLRSDGLCRTSDGPLSDSDGLRRTPIGLRRTPTAVRRNFYPFLTPTESVGVRSD